MPACPPARAPEPPARAPFGIYIHWPFCVSKCPYCDFNSHVAGAPVDHALWADMLTRELDTLLAEQEGPRHATSVFFGGGTPSLMSPRSVAAVLDAVERRCHLQADAEITLEANPESASPAALQGFRAAGVNRLSLGVQSLDDAALRALGRPHDSAAALAAVRAAQKCFRRVSLDLIYARPRQTLAQWRRELARVLQEDIGHLSLYQLTIEPGTPYARWHESGRLTPPGEQEALAQLRLARDLCAEAGLPHYETSNHARPGEECRHNLLYWRYGFYAGIGPGAHGRLPGRRNGERIATETLRDPARWLRQVRERGHGLAQRQRLTPAQQADELLLMGLRLREGVDIRRLAPPNGSGQRQLRLREPLAEGLLWRRGERIGCTPRGEPVLDSLLPRLLA